MADSILDVSVKEDWIVWARFSTELLDEGAARAELGEPAASSERRREAASFFCAGSWAPQISLAGPCCLLDLGVSLACRALAAVRCSASSPLHLASMASITASQTSLGTSFCVMSSRLTHRACPGMGLLSPSRPGPARPGARLYKSPKAWTAYRLARVGKRLGTVYGEDREGSAGERAQGVRQDRGRKEADLPAVSMTQSVRTQSHTTEPRGTLAFANGAHLRAV